MSRWNTLELIETERHVVTVVLNRPQARNAISRQLAEELVDCLTVLRERSGLRVLLLTGAGGAFCAGADLKEREAGGDGHARHQREALLRAIELIERFPAPVIAMVDGPAIAGGMELALACDLRVATERARFGLPEVRVVGSFPGAGGPVRLARMIGRGRASLVVLTGRTFTAREACALGFVEQVVPDAELQAHTLAIAREMAAGSPRGVRAVRQLIRQSVDLDLHSAMDLSRALRDPLDDTEDFREGISAWREKRPPVFSED